MQDGILSIQSAVAYGHVGNSAAVFPLQRLGFEVWPVNTVLFSNHTGYGAWRGRGVELEWVEELIEGVAERGAIPRTRAVLSGYLGDPSLGAAVLRAVARVRAARADMLYACDPVMGDEGRGFFVRPGIPEFFRDHAVPAADIVTPNQFELAWLAGRSIASLEEAVAAAAAVRATGPRIVVCTSLDLGERSGHPRPQRRGELALPHAAAAHHAERYRRRVHGAVPRLLAEDRHLGCCPRPMRSRRMYALVEATHRAGSRELELIAAQDQLLAPAATFEAVRVA